MQHKMFFHFTNSIGNKVKYLVSFPKPADIIDEVMDVGGLGTGQERAGDRRTGDIGRTSSGLNSLCCW